MQSCRSVLGIFVITLCTSCCLLSGDDDNTGIEIAGTWEATDIDAETGGVGTEDLTYTISESSISGTLSASGSVSATILEYSNDSDYAVTVITAHFMPSFVGKYEKIEWQLTDPNHFQMSAYSLEDTHQLAKDSVTVIWGPTILTRQ